MSRSASVLITIVASLSAAVVLAKLPPPSDAAKAAAAEAAAKKAHADKVAAFKQCRIEDRLAAEYVAAAKRAGKAVKPPLATPPCADPGAFVAKPAAMAATPAKK